MLVKMEQEMKVIKRNLKATHDNKKNYVNKHRSFKEFQVGENVYLCINPKRISVGLQNVIQISLITIHFSPMLPLYHHYSLPCHFIFPIAWVSFISSKYYLL